MVKKQKQSENAGKPGTAQKNKKKILQVKVGDFITVSVYDLVTWVGIGLSIGFVLIYGSQGNTRGIRWSIASLVFFVLIMLAIRAKQHFFQPVAPKERPELYISGTRLGPLSPGEPETVVMGIKNRGKATARNIRLGGGNHLFTTSSFSGPLEYKPVEATMQTDLGPGEENSLVSRSDQPLTAKRIKELQDGKVLFFHFAEGEYDDDDGNTYPIDFCYMYMPLSPTVMRICPEKYWPKDRKDRKFPGLPQLIVEQVVIDRFKVGQAESVRLVIRNKGKATALDVVIESTYCHTPPSYEGPLIYETVTPEAVPTIVPDDVLTSISRSPWMMTIRDIKDILAGRMLLFFYGRVRYLDETGSRYGVKFCLLYDPTIPGTMKIAPSKYWPEDSADE